MNAVFLADKGPSLLLRFGALFEGGLVGKGGKQGLYDGVFLKGGAGEFYQFGKP